jgi:hypothetical protein
VEDNSVRMAPTACEKRWAEILESFQRNLDDLIRKNPESVEDIKLLQARLVTIGQIIQSSPRVNGNGAVWKATITKAEAESAVLCKHLEGKALFAGMTRLYAATHAELSSTLKTEEEESPGEFREQRRRKRNPSDELPTAPKKMVPAAPPSSPRRTFSPPSGQRVWTLTQPGRRPSAPKRRRLL